MTPSDRVARNFLHGRRFLGSKDRRFVSETYYHAIRHLLRLDESLRIALENAPHERWLQRTTGFPLSSDSAAKVWANPPFKGKSVGEVDRWFDSFRMAMAAEELHPGSFQEIEDTFVRDWKVTGGWFHENWLRRTMNRALDTAANLSNETNPLRLHLKHSIPEWMWGLIGYGLPPQEAETAIAALNTAAPTTLRINRLKISTEDYLALLAEKEIEAQRGELAHDAVILSKRHNPGDLPGFKEGLFEFQDEGSQLLTELIRPEPGQRVIDACAGAGGKSLHFAACMENQGQVLVHDISPGRLKNAMKRADLAGASIIQPFDADPDKAPNPDQQADIVLVDAPCTGIGTIRRSPELKWRVTMETLQQRARIQTQLLEQWSHWVKPGGRLIYATCSLLQGENSERINYFLSKSRGFQRAQWSDTPPYRTEMRTREGNIQLYPHRQGTDGFFLAALERKP